MMASTRLTLFVALLAASLPGRSLAQCSAPGINALPSIAAVPSVALTLTLRYTVVGGCTPAGVITCTETSSDPASVAVIEPKTVRIAAGVSTGGRTVTISCSEAGGATARATTSVTIVTPSGVTIQTAARNQPAGDGSPLVIKPEMLTSVAPGGFPESFICYKITDKTVGSWSGASSHPSCDFTQADINARNVAFIPPTLSHLGTSSTVSVAFTVSNTLGDSASGTISFAVTSAVALALGNNPATVTTRSMSPFVLGTSQIGLVEQHRFTTWEATWTWPSIPGMGVWEWYCPDKLCNGPGWVQFAKLPTTVQQSWLILNAIRWNPNGIAGSSSTFDLSGAFAGNSVTQRIVLTSSESATPQVPPPTPYNPASYSGCGEPYVLNKGGISKDFKLPFGPFAIASPLRPLCTRVTADAGQTVVAGDVSLTPSVATSMGVSGWINIGDVALPAGFTPIAFAGTSSMVGTVHSAIMILSSVSGPIRLVSPQLPYTPPNGFPFNTRADVAVLAYDGNSGKTSFLGASAWNDDLSNPSRITANLPGGGIYIFGTVSGPSSNALPAAYGTNVEYSGSWKSRSYSFNDLTVTISSGSDFVFGVTPTQMPSKLSVTVLSAFIVGITPASGSLDNAATITLKTKTEAGYVWALYSTASNAAGGSWYALPNTANTDGSIQVTIKSSGTYGIVNAGAVSSNAVSSFQLNGAFGKALVAAVLGLAVLA
ncbi:hypothetical protein BC831DRAFT_286938 [Entophlyctis helioformis]|nr:hypothetical protein BC831DRAFT_286938 [Entophlyctis helioformis]